MELLRRPVQRLKKDLENLLEGQANLPTPNPAAEKSVFTPMTDLSDMPMTLGLLPADPLVRMTTLFSRLSLYFESGLLLTREPDSTDQRELWTPEAAFVAGEYFALGSEMQNNCLSLPFLGYGELRRSIPYSLLAPLQLEDLADSEHSSAFAVKLSETKMAFLLTQLPDPWLRLHMEKIHRQLLRITSEVE